MDSECDLPLSNSLLLILVDMFGYDEMYTSIKRYKIENKFYVDELQQPHKFSIVKFKIHI